ncbi:MAG: hypothetical protein BWY57_03138 [Betaproteobacteria bacterium ADurb.Bin341]|nr:MAG: hypothetical protein BWY57_03138 [Betaproteobacteria bacterium ADurb.Bin341]
MKESLAILPCLLLALALPLEVFAMPPKTKAPETCNQKLLITRADCPWVGMTETYEREQANKLVKASPIEKHHTPFPALASFDQKNILLAKNDQSKTVQINQNYFSDLRRGDATRLAKNAEHAIGTFRDLAFKRLSPAKLVEFLLLAQIVETYWHLEADLCLTGEEDKDDSYRADFRGMHRYCTNRCEEEAFAFSIRIDKKTGAMTLIGR